MFTRGSFQKKVQPIKIQNTNWKPQLQNHTQINRKQFKSANFKVRQNLENSAIQGKQNGKLKETSNGKSNGLDVVFQDYLQYVKTPEHEDTVLTLFVAETLLPTKYGDFRLRGYRHKIDAKSSFSEPTAIINGVVEGQEKVPVRVHDACYTSEVLGSLKCDCAQQLEAALLFISQQERGIVIYLQQEGRGIGLANKIAAYALQEKGHDTVDANRLLGLPDDCREYYSVKNILKDLNVKSIDLMTNNPRKIRLLREMGVQVNDRLPVLVKPGQYNKKYLEDKQKKMEHIDTGNWFFVDHQDGVTIEMKKPNKNTPIVPIVKEDEAQQS